MAEEAKVFMECRNFELTVHKAENLPNVRKNGETRAYAKIIIGSGERNINCQSEPDNINGFNPIWDYAKTYEVAETGVQNYGLTVTIELYCDRTCRRDKYIGEIRASMKDLYDQALPQGITTSALPILQGTTTTTGILHFSYSFNETFAVRETEFKSRANRFGTWFMENVAPVAAAKVTAQAAKETVKVTAQAAKETAQVIESTLSEAAEQLKELGHQTLKVAMGEN